MTENFPPPPPAPDQPTQPAAPAYGAPPPAPYGTAPYGTAPYGTAPYGTAPMGYAMPGAGQPGQIRSTGICILLAIVTFGIYSLYWYYQTHEEMKRHTGQGLGGVVALLLALFVGIVMPFITSAEVGAMREGAGREKKVSAMTGLWYFPGVFILVGPIVWFVKTNGAINDHWRSLGVQG